MRLTEAAKKGYDLLVTVVCKGAWDQPHVGYCYFKVPAYQLLQGREVVERYLDLELFRAVRGAAGYCSEQGVEQSEKSLWRAWSCFLPPEGWEGEYPMWDGAW